MLQKPLTNSSQTLWAGTNHRWPETRAGFKQRLIVILWLDMDVLHNTDWGHFENWARAVK